MQQSKKNKSSKWWLIVKLLLAVISLWFIYLRIFSHENSLDSLAQLKAALQQPGVSSWIVLVVVLMFINWFVEAVKWKFMVDRIVPVKLSRAVEAVFSGITFSFFTPNRIGEYAGRVFHLPAEKRLQATFITIIENSSQLLITILTGSAACIIYLSDYMEISAGINLPLRFMLAAFSVSCFLLFFNVEIFGKLLQRFSRSGKWKDVLHVFALYSWKDLSKVLLLSLLRYLVFSIQFYLLLKIYGCAFDFLPAMLMISLTFFVMAIVPTFAIAEIGVRGAVAAYFFGKLTIDVLPVLNATVSLWLINLALPALIGTFFIFDFRLGKNGK